MAEATALAERSLAAIGLDAEQVHVIAAHLVDAELCGVSFAGLPRILTIHEDARTRQPRFPITTIHETAVSAMLDGGNNVGYFAVQRAAELAVGKARTGGIAVVGIHHTHLSGRNSYYMELIARAGLVAMMTASSPPMVLPHGGKRAAFGTNPISYGFPLDRDPFIVDLGTAAMMRGDVIFRSRTSESLPPGIAIDAEGAPTDDPAAMLAGGGLFTFGGHRGAALSFGIQALGLLAGAARTAGRVQDFGFLFVVIDPAILMPAHEFKAQLHELIETVRAVPPLDAAKPVRIPSERAFRMRERRRGEGITLNRRVHEQLEALAR